MTEQVLAHHLSAFAVGVDEIMKDYTDESALIAPEGTYRGLVEIRAFFQGFVDKFPAEAWESFQILRTEVVGEIGYQTWDARPFIMLGTDTFLVRDGKIVVQTYASHAG